MASTGKCVSWKGAFGFVEDDKTKEQIFVHNSSINVVEGGYRSLNVGQEVQYDVATQPDGKSRAENVSAIGGGALPSGERVPLSVFFSPLDCV
jgi:cold shock CspA family protein